MARKELVLVGGTAARRRVRQARDWTRAKEARFLGAQARRAGALLASGKLDGLSFGYRVGRAERVGGVRELSELELIEVSLVAKPMQRLARVHAVEG